MTLTIQQIYDSFSVRDFCQKVELKRRKTDGSYETDWQDIEELSGLELLDNSVGTISYQANNNNYNFGVITSGNVALKLNSKNGQFDDETNSGSVFKNYVRHGSLVRIKYGYVDKYTDPNNPEDVLEQVFYGFIDANAEATKVDEMNLLQTLQCVDALSFLLKSYSIADLGALSSTTLSDLIYEILNRSQFTQFFTVSTLNIDPGYDITDFDVTLYEDQTTLFNLFENFSLGHSYYYLKNGVFYYGALTAGQTNTLEVDEKKIIKFAAYNSGASNVFERFNWADDDSVSFVAVPNKYNKGKTIEIKGVTDQTQRLNILNTCGNIAKVQRKQFNLVIPCYMFINIMDQILVDSPTNIPSDAFIWGVSKWGEARWRKSQQADSIPSSVYWLVKSIKHSSNLTTDLILEEVVV